METENISFEIKKIMDNNPVHIRISNKLLKLRDAYTSSYSMFEAINDKPIGNIHRAICVPILNEIEECLSRVTDS